MERIFVYDGREFPDPDPAAPVEDVKKMMQDFFPELANAEVREHAKGEDKVVHEFIRRVGTKGLVDDPGGQLGMPLGYKQAYCNCCKKYTQHEIWGHPNKDGTGGQLTCTVCGSERMDTIQGFNSSLM